MKTINEISRAIDLVSVPFVVYDRHQLRNVIKNITGIDAEERKYKIGMRFKINGETCILAAGDAWKVCIINVTTGVRKGKTVPCHRWHNITQEMFDACLTDEHRGKDITFDI